MNLYYIELITFRIFFKGTVKVAGELLFTTVLKKIDSTYNSSAIYSKDVSSQSLLFTIKTNEQLRPSKSK